MAESQAHEHKWEGYPENTDMLVCWSCETMTRIKDLLNRVELRGVVRGDYNANISYLQKGWIKRHRRQKVADYVRDHPITRQKELAIPRQERLIKQ